MVNSLSGRDARNRHGEEPETVLLWFAFWNCVVGLTLVVTDCDVSILSFRSLVFRMCVSAEVWDFVRERM